VKPAEAPLSDAANVADCATEPAATVAENVAVLLLLVTFTDPGTVTDGLLLDRATETPPLGAGSFRVTVQASVPDPVTAALEQLSPETRGAAALAA
jgi:hypothetical protein